MDGIFILRIFSEPLYVLMWLAVVVFSICVHELFHALAAHYEGDDTAKAQGYFTLNPLVHMGGTSLLFLLVLGIAWGMCPVDPSRFRHRYGDALVAFAGPFANLLLMVFFALGVTMTAILTAPEQALTPADPVSLTMAKGLIQFFGLGALLNGALFLWNMIPLYPFDGHSIVRSFFPQTEAFYQKLGTGGFILIFALFWLVPGLSSALWDTAAFMASSCITLFKSILGA